MTACPFCLDDGERSKVYVPTYSVTTAMADPPAYYDEDGVYHRHELNSSTSEWSCSRGHRWTVKSRAACPAGDDPGMHEVSRIGSVDQ